MNKSTNFTGQPVFTQLLSYLHRPLIQSIATKQKSDHYTKRFSTYGHLVTMLYSVFNNCDSLREVTTGLLAWEERISHLGINFHPRRSTLSDANRRRSEKVFEEIYLALFAKYKHFLSDSRSSSKKLYVFDSTTITLFKEILKGAGRSNLNGKRKGGIKVHTLMDHKQAVPKMIRFSAAAANDSQFLKEVDLPTGSVLVFDRGYPDYRSYNRFSQQKITWVTRLRKNASFDSIQDLEVSDFNRKRGVLSDQLIVMGHNLNKKAIKVKSRLIQYKDSKTNKTFQFITNNTDLSALTIAQYYKKRWKIELLFKQLKQNYPLKSFLGDNENAIKIQIWTTLIANLIVQIIRNLSKTKLSFSNMVAMIRVYIGTYIHLFNFIRNPEKALRRSQLKNEFRGIQYPLFEP